MLFWLCASFTSISGVFLIIILRINLKWLLRLLVLVHPLHQHYPWRLLHLSMGINPILLLIVYHLRHFFIVLRSPPFKLLLLPIQLIRLHPLYAPDLFSQLYIWRRLVLPLPRLPQLQRLFMRNPPVFIQLWGILCRWSMLLHPSIPRETVNGR